MVVHARRAALGVVTLLFAATALALYAKHHGLGGLSEGYANIIAGALGVAAALACGVGVGMLPDAPETTEPTTAHPYRGLSFARRASLPHVSARSTVVAILACMIFTALAVPFALHLPRWLEIEGVLGGWWVLWIVALAALAYGGRPIADGGAALWPGGDDPKPAVIQAKPRSGFADWFGWLDLAGAGDLGLGIVLVVLAFVATFAAAWLVVELVAPALFLGAYLGLTHALARARAAKHRGELARSALHGMVWATAYVAPLAVAVAMVHAVARPLDCVTP